MPQVEIIPADFVREDHQQAIRELINSYAGDAMGQEGSLPADVLERMVPGLAAHPTCHVWLAYAEARPVGVAVCFRGFSTFAARPILNIHDFAILPEWRGRGIGRALIEHVLAAAKALGCAKVTLEVRQDNAIAQALYRAVGFQSGDEPMQFWTCKL